jgi:hypothetical protein
MRKNSVNVEKRMQAKAYPAVDMTSTSAPTTPLFEDAKLVMGRFKTFIQTYTRSSMQAEVALQTQGGVKIWMDLSCTRGSKDIRIRHEWLLQSYNDLSNAAASLTDSAILILDLHPRLIGGKLFAFLCMQQFPQMHCMRDIQSENMLPFLF